MDDRVDTVVIGAGPYGLSIAAHLRAAGADYRIYGQPMSAWSSMPRGMVLKSQGFASNLSSPDGRHTLEDFCTASGQPYARSGLPITRDTFLAYGMWFQQSLLPDVQETLVTNLSAPNGHFEVTLADGDGVQARNVVVAAGFGYFSTIPDLLASLPPGACSHSSAHADLGAFRGQRVIVLGAGQSALESAALLHEEGAAVQLVARKSSIVWNRAALPPTRPLAQRVREPHGGLGPGWRNWFVSEHPELWWYLPEGTRVHRVKTSHGPAGASWLFDRVNDRFPVWLGQKLLSAAVVGSEVRLEFASADGTTRQLTADHVIAGTGYRPDLGRLPFLDADLGARLRTVADTAVVDRGFQSSVPGLYFIGTAVAPAFGPVMRFVYGADFAATTVARQLTGPRGRAGRRAGNLTDV
jgi:thioredoxin reductase